MKLRLSKKFHSLALAFLGAVSVLHSPAIAAAVSSDQYAIVPVPTWVRSVDTPRVNESSEVVGGERHVLVDRQLHDNGSRVAYHRHFVTDVVGQAGLSRASKLSISFDPAYEKLQLHSATVLRNGQLSDRLNTARIDVARTEDSSDRDLLNGEVTALVVLANVHVGDRVEVRYTVVGRNPVFDKRHHSAWNTRWGVPVERSVLTISVPQNMALSHTPRPSAHFSEVVNAGLRTLQWHWDDLKSSEAEDNTTAWFEDPDRMDVTAFQSWQEVADWGAQLFAGHAKQSAAYQKLSQRIVKHAQKHGKQAAIAAAIDHVQKRIRYYGVELGENSHRPHSPDEVIKNGYGDCKDKALLLVSLLEDLGVNAWPILVSARTKKGIVDRLPSPGVFDHAIVLVKQNGEQFWVDATDNTQSGFLGYRGQPEYGAALVLGKPGDALITRKAPMPKQATISTHDKFYLSGIAAPVDFVSATTYRGRDANRMRQRFDESGIHRMEKKYRDYYKRMYGDLVSLDKLHIEKNAAKNAITVTASYRLKEFWEIDKRYDTSEFEAYAYIVANHLDDFEDVDEDRHAPLPLYGRTWVAHRIQYYPSVASAELELEESSFSIPGFSFFDSEYVLGDSWVFESEIKVSAEELEPDRLKAYNRFKERVSRRSNSGRFFSSVNKKAAQNGAAVTTLIGELGELY